MKTLKMAAALVALGALAVSCSGKGDKAGREYTPEEVAYGDSIATALGHVAGAENYSNFQRMKAQMTPEELKNFSQDEFLKGLKTVLDTDTANIAYLSGLYTGLNLYNPMVGSAQAAGCPVDPQKVYDAFVEAYKADTITHEIQSKYQKEYSDLNAAIQQRAQMRRIAEQREQIDANTKAGAEYADKMLADGYQKTETGLIYKINDQGKGAKVTPESRIKIHYEGKHINGETFDKSGAEGYEAQPTMFVPGFSEGLMLLNQGGSATLVIPAELAYGDNGAGSKIQPGETLVFEISVEE